MIGRMAREKYKVETGKDGLHHVIRQCDGSEEIFETHGSREMALRRAVECNDEAVKTAAAVRWLPRFWSP
jgi:hypothetical protein